MVSTFILMLNFSDPEMPSTMGVVKSFLHKVSKERMIAAGAKIPDKEQVRRHVNPTYLGNTSIRQRVTSCVMMIFVIMMCTGVCRHWVLL